HLPSEPDEREALEAWLSARAGRRVRIVVPQRGEKRGFVDLANRNAALAYQTRFNQAKAAQYDALETLQHVLALPALPRRIECFDISTIQGSETVASMVVCEDGRKGQLTAAYAALEELGLANLVAVGIAKKEELLYTRDREDPIALASTDPALLLVQRIRDEAHRFAVAFHRRARAMRDLRSELDHIPGIGPRRRKTLLTTFGSLAGVRRATREELAAVVGAKSADAVLAFFASRP